MPNPITDVSEFTDVTSPATGEAANQGVFAAGLQALANRTRYLLDHLGGDITLAVNRVLGRRSTGSTGGQPATDFSFDLLALSTAIAHADALHTRGTAVASASTANIAGASGLFVHITGTTQVDGFGTAAAGVVRIITFDDVLTLTHNPSGIIIPGGADLVTAAGAAGLVVSEGAGVWRLISWQPPVAPNAGRVRRITRVFNFDDADIDIASTNADITLATGLDPHALLIACYIEDGNVAFSDGLGEGSPISDLTMQVTSGMNDSLVVPINTEYLNPVDMNDAGLQPGPIGQFDDEAVDLVVQISATGAALNTLTAGSFTLRYFYVDPAD